VGMISSRSPMSFASTAGDGTKGNALHGSQ
jgi:hypothetical protein